MTDSVIGALRVVLGADTAALDKGLSDSQIKLAAFAGAVGGIAAGMAGEFLKAAKSIGSSITDVIDSADKLNKLSQQTGMTTEELSKLSYAAGLADVPMEALTKSVTKLSKAMVDAAGDGASQAGRAFTAMGVTVKNVSDGSLRPSADVLADIADKFAGYKDGAEKTSLAVALFGKAGAAMIPLLNEGRDGLQELGDEAQKYGLVLDKQTTAAAEAFNDNLRKMDMIKQGVSTTMTAKLLPAFQALSEVLLKSREESTLWNAIGDVMAGVINKLVAAGIALITTWQRIFATVADLKSAFSDLASGNFQAAWDTMKKSASETSDALGGLATQIRQIVAPTDLDKFWQTQIPQIKAMNAEVQELGKAWTQTAAPIVASGEAQKDAIQKFLDAQAKRTAAMTAEAQTIGGTIGQQEYLKTVYQAQAIALQNNIPLTAALNTQIALQGQASAAAALQIAGAQATVAARNPTEQFNAQMTQLKQLYDAGVISLDTYNERQKQVAEQAGAAWNIAGASIAGSFATISAAFGKESKGMAVAAQAFGVIQATISMFTGAAKALELPFPANLAAMAAVLAQGATLVARIKSQTVPTGFMTGGSFKVGGSGGPDSQRVAFMASPGEQVDVWRPGQGPDPRNGASSGSPTTVNVSMPVVTTRDAMRAIIEGINDMVRDGYRLNVVPA